MEAVYSFYQTTQYHIPEDITLQSLTYELSYFLLWSILQCCQYFPQYNVKTEILPYHLLTKSWQLVSWPRLEMSISQIQVWAWNRVKAKQEIRTEALRKLRKPTFKANTFLQVSNSMVCWGRDKWWRETEESEKWARYCNFPITCISWALW